MGKRKKRKAKIKIDPSYRSWSGRKCPKCGSVRTWQAVIRGHTDYGCHDCHAKWAKA